MIYKHQYFSLNKDKRIVFDENNKELRLTGNAFRVLVFLCEKLNANVTEIGDYLDWAKDYDENHIRQYRYKTNTVIGHDVIKYNNSIYSLVGNIEKCEKIEKNDRNTDLLHDDSVESKKNDEENIMQKINKIKFSKNPAIIVSILSILALFSMPYGFYTLLRIIITIIAAYYVYYIYQQNLIEEMSLWFWGLIFFALLFNPIFPVYLNREVWAPINIITAVFFVAMAQRNKFINK